jgi:hypothetical protein
LLLQRERGLHKYVLTLEDVYARYGSRVLSGLSAADLAFYAEHRYETPLEEVGADSAANVVSYTLPQPADFVRKSSTSQPAVFVPAS